MSDWETRMSERAQRKRRAALAEERAAMPPIRRSEFPEQKWIAWSLLCDGSDRFETVTFDGMTYRVIA